MINSNNDWINKHKVIVPYAVELGDSKTDYIKPLIVSQVLVIQKHILTYSSLKSKKECQNVISYIKT